MNDHKSALPSAEGAYASADMPPFKIQPAVAKEHREGDHFLERHFVIISALSILGALAGWGGSFFMTKVYRAEVVTSPASSESGSPLKSLMGSYGAIAGLVGLPLADSGNTTSTTIAILESHQFLEGFIAKDALLPVLFRKQWDSAHSRWKPERSQPPPSPEDGFLLFRDRILTVLYDQQTDLVTVRVEWSDPMLAAKWANELVEQLNTAARNRAITSADLRISYLSKQLTVTKPIEIRDTIYSLLQSEVSRRMIAETRPAFALTVIDPAQAPGRKKYVRPIPIVFALIGFFLGALIGVGAGVASIDPFARPARP